MSEWWTYTLSDFLLFSPRVYFRLLELHNRELWPAHLLASGAGAAVLGLWLRPGRHGPRIVLGLLGAAWLWVAWSFFWERYATINWAVAYVAPVFAAEGLLLVWFGAIRPGPVLDPARDRRAWAGPALLAFTLVGYPLLAPLAGRAWLGAESFAIMPDPTAVATLAVLSALNGGRRWLLMAVPMLWCVIGSATLLALESDDFAAPAAGAMLALIASVRRRPVGARFRPGAGSP